MLIQRLTPAPGLQHLIKCYYYIENSDDRTFSDTYFSDGCIEVVFSTGWEFYKDKQKEDWAKVIGQIVKPRTLEITGKGRSFGIWFYPHAFSYFTGLNLSELNDRVISWDLLFPHSVSQFVGNCLENDQLVTLVEGMNTFWLNQLSKHRETRADRIVEVAVNYLFQEKSADLGRLPKLLNVTQRYLQKLFVARIGFSPKHLQRILRFQDVLRTLPSYTSSLTNLAYEHHYYDQSHFVREFKEFTGHPPSDFDTTQLPINQHFIGAE